MSDDPAPLVVYFRPCRVCGELVGTLKGDRAPICQPCAAKETP